MNVKIIFMLFFIFLVGIIPISFAEEENDRFLWKKSGWESKYFIHFQVQVRNIDDTLLSVTETFNGEYSSDSMTDLVYLEMPLKKVVEISNEEYEMRQVANPFELKLIEKDFLDPTDYLNTFDFGYDIDGQFTAVFHAYPAMFLTENSDIVTVQWTILKKI